MATALQTHQLVQERAALKAQVKEPQARLREVERQLAAQAAKDPLAPAPKRGRVVAAAAATTAPAAEAAEEPAAAPAAEATEATAAPAAVAAAEAQPAQPPQPADKGSDSSSRKKLGRASVRQDTMERPSDKQGRPQDKSC